MRTLPTPLRRLRTLGALLAAAGALAVALAVGLAAGGPAGAQEEDPPTQAGPVTVLEVSGLIDPIEVDFVQAALRSALADGDQALVIQLDSGGAVVPVAKLDALLFRIQHSEVPVAVWIGPSGARAGGAAARLVRAAAVAGIAPGSSVAGGRGSIPRLKAAPTLGDFIVELNGVPTPGGVLQTAKVVREAKGPRLQPTVPVRFAKLGLLARLLHTVASPSVAYLLLLVGALLVVFEFFTGGIGVAAAVAAGSLVLSAYGLGVLPTRGWAVALVLAGILGYAVDLQAGSPRFWTVAGTLLLVAGSVTLFDGLRVPLLTLAVLLAGVALFMVSGMPAVIRTRYATPTIGRDRMIGELGVAVDAVDPEGTVQILGATWRARTNRATPVAAGDRVRVVGIDGLLLEVEPEAGGARDYRDGR